MGDLFEAVCCEVEREVEGDFGEMTLGRDMLKELFLLADAIYVETASIGYDLGIPSVADKAQKIKKLVNALETHFGVKPTNVSDK